VIEATSGWHGTERTSLKVAAHPWMPLSPCDEACLPAPGEEPSVGLLRVGLRMTAAASALLVGTVIAAVFPLFGERSRLRIIRWWFRAVLAAFGITMRVTGTGTVARSRAPRGALVVANHVSWLDIVVLDAIRPCRMVAKREVRDWFVIGWLATAAGSLYLDRERLRTLPATVAQIADALGSGQTMAVFPEGTTSCGRESRRYRAAAFQAAIDADVPVVPVALHFLLADGTPTTAPAYVDTDLSRALVRTARLRGLQVHAEVLPELSPRDYPNRRALALAAERAVAAVSGTVPPSERLAAVKVAGQQGCTPISVG
jgi:1-acyl-sn-glycerol-3-phosphate acyltransferase